jgi:chorismate--pyruvate lyase
MPPEPNSAIVQAGSFWHQADFQLPPDQRRNLRRPGSLSSRMQRWCEGALPVSVVHQGHGLPTRDEARLLGLRPRERVWVREVRLGPPRQPWVKGRTVAPLREMQGPAQNLRNLGNRPLGSVLFNGRAWRRSPFLIGRMEASDLPGYLPARRSVFYHRGNRLLVTEGFYPAFWQQLRQERNEQGRPGPVTTDTVPVPDPIPEAP